MAIRAAFVRIISRPLLVPIAMGSFGLWYGGYDISYITTKNLGSSIFPPAVKETTRSNKVASSISGLSMGSAFAYAFYATSNFKNVEFPNIEKGNFVKNFPSYIKNNVAVLKTLNVQRGVFVFVCSGFISGFTKGAVETYLNSGESKS